MQSAFAFRNRNDAHLLFLSLYLFNKCPLQFSNFPFLFVLLCFAKWKKKCNESIIYRPTCSLNISNGHWKTHSGRPLVSTTWSLWAELLSWGISRVAALPPWWGISSCCSCGDAASKQKEPWEDFFFVGKDKENTPPRSFVSWGPPEGSEALKWREPPIHFSLHLAGKSPRERPSTRAVISAGSRANSTAHNLWQPRTPAPRAPCTCYGNMCLTKRRETLPPNDRGVAHMAVNAEPINIHALSWIAVACLHNLMWHIWRHLISYQISWGVSSFSPAGLHISHFTSFIHEGKIKSQR